MLPTHGIWIPVTAVLNLDQPRKPVLELLDPTRVGQVPVGSATMPLAANFTAPLARDFQDRAGELLDFGALVNFDKYSQFLGLTRASSFGPDKEVVILTHGIFSDPTTWDKALNSFFRDEDLRNRYEFWLFGYPTGAPIPYLASELRREIHDLIAYRASQGAPDTRITLVGHSMGGLLSKAMIQTSGKDTWDKLFTVSPEELDMSTEDQQLLESMVFFEPIDQVKRVVFIATPHRGSRLADFAPIELVAKAIKVPQVLLHMSNSLLSDNREYLTPLAMQLLRKGDTAVVNLQEGAASLSINANAFNLNKGVALHSIMGNIRPAGRKDVRKSGDGVVSYRSSHLEGVQSETVIDGVGHAIHRKEETFQEIIRILKGR